MKQAVTTIVMIACACLTGCGTIHTLTENKYNAPQNQYWVYGGVRMDWDFVAGPPSPFLPRWVRVFGIADVPFSAVADTVCLPYTIPKAVSEKKKREESSNK